MPGVLIGALILLWGIQAPVGMAFAAFVLDLPHGSPSRGDRFPDDRRHLAGLRLSVGPEELRDRSARLRSRDDRSPSRRDPGLAAEYGGIGALAGLTLGLVSSSTFSWAASRGISLWHQEPFGFLPASAILGSRMCGAVLQCRHLGRQMDDVALARREIRRAGADHPPAYDSSMFLAYLTIVPALVLFLVSIETRFFEQYVEFYRDIQGHATLQKIRDNHKSS